MKLKCESVKRGHGVVEEDPIIQLSVIPDPNNEGEFRITARVFDRAFISFGDLPVSVWKQYILEAIADAVDNAETLDGVNP